MGQPEDINIDLETILHGSHEGKKPELRLWLRLLSTVKLISQEIRRRLRNEFQMTLPQFDLMSQLYREPDGLRLGELSKRTMVTNGNVTGLVERLETDGLVIRANLDGDRRVTVARLTPRGAEMFATMAAAHESWLKDLMADVDPAIVRALVDDVGAIKSSVNNHLSGHDDI